MPGIHVLARCPAGPVTAADLVGRAHRRGEPRYRENVSICGRHAEELIIGWRVRKNLAQDKGMIEGFGSGIRVWRTKTGRVYPLPPITSLLSPCSALVEQVLGWIS